MVLSRRSLRVVYRCGCVRSARFRSCLSGVRPRENSGDLLPTMPSSPRVAYLCSKYPALSHAFVLREVQALRDTGVEVSTFSVRATPEGELLSHDDRREHATTFAILPTSVGRLGRAHLRALRAGPGAYAKTFARALKTGGTDVRAVLWQVFYFAEAMILWGELERIGVRHVHVHFANAALDVAQLAVDFGSGIRPGGWTYSFTLHGPADLLNTEQNRLAAKAREASFVACISDFARSQLMMQLQPSEWGKLEVVHCAVDTERFRVG